MNVPDDGPAAIVLGITQDAGLPHVGCLCARCRTAFDNPSLAQYTASLAVVDIAADARKVWLIDATPDIKYQLDLLHVTLGHDPLRPDRIRQPDGIFLTHGHMGHISGLLQLGKEGMAVQGMKLYGPSGLMAVIRKSPFWQPLTGQLELISLEPDRPIRLSPHLTITPIPVPHRDELEAGVFAYRLEGESRSLLYIPDIDSWTSWPRARQVLGSVDSALVDATFFTGDELHGLKRPAHPLVQETLSFFEDIAADLFLTHLNHTNPLLDKDSKESRMVVEAGASVSYTSQVFRL